MITRCPTCATAFRVTEAQLEACSGQVRCGQCRQVFNGRTSLLEPDAPAVHHKGSAAPSVAAPAHATEHLDDPTRLSRKAGPHAGEAAQAVDPVGVLDASDAPALESQATPQATLLTPPEPVPADAAPGAPDARNPDSTPPEAPPLAPTGFAPDAAAAVMPEFSSGKRHRAPRRWIWLPLSTVLLALLFAQAVFYFRGEVALLFPEAKPWLAVLCEDLGCSLPLPHRAELMSIESSDLQGDTTNASVMVLTATLRNRAIFPQAHPLLELTLTNVQDQAVARRVLNARDYLPRGTALDQGFPPGAEVPVKVFLEAEGLKATGYRLYLFYP